MGRSKRTRFKQTTVWLEGDYNAQGGADLKLFFCINCGNILAKYRGNVVQLVPGDSPVSIGAEIQCSGDRKNEQGEWEKCGYRFIFSGVADPILNSDE